MSDSLASVLMHGADEPDVDMQVESDEALSDLVRRYGVSQTGKAAMSALFERHREVAIRQAFRLTGDRAHAEDVVAETFALILHALQRGNGPRESFVGYLMISLRTTALRTGQADGIFDLMAPDSLGSLPEFESDDHAEHLAERDQVIRAFRTLPPESQQLLWLLDVEQMAPEHAAAELRIGEGSLRVRAHRARKRLGTAYLQQYVRVAKPECSAPATMLASFARDELGQRKTDFVGKHLANCADCTQQLKTLRSLAAHLRAWAAPVIGGGVLAGIAAASGDHLPQAAALEPMRRVPLWVPGLAGAALLIVGGVLIMNPDAAPNVNPASPVAPAQTASAARVAGNTVNPANGADIADAPPTPDVFFTPAAASPGVAGVPAVDGESATWIDDATPRWRVVEP